MVRKNFNLQTEMKMWCKKWGVSGLFPLTVFADLNLTICAQVQALRCCSPDLFYNGVLFFDRQEHSGICVLKPHQKVQSKHYGPGTLSLSPHGLWLITIAKGGILCIRDVRTLVSYPPPFFFYLGMCILISFKEQKALREGIGLLS